ncbi:hypothetical protein D1007_38910 [Hordeum vulgare]|nr:hypothetical protein D1007_38910 [Hordeum vulgare]
MFLTRGVGGWKSFARSRGIGRGISSTSGDGSTTLFLKFLVTSGVRLECCAESSSGSDIDTSCDIGDDSSVFSVKQDGDDSEYHGQHHGDI